VPLQRRRRRVHRPWVAVALLLILRVGGVGGSPMGWLRDGGAPRLLVPWAVVRCFSESRWPRGTG
jgi:hypothetical protein